VNTEKRSTIDKITFPIQRFIQQEKSGGIVMGISVIIALFLANSTWSDWYFGVFNHKIGFIFDKKTYLEYSILHWINHGLMATFFFVIGMELKREIVTGELSKPRKAVLPIGAALGGMLVPAIIYLSLNSSANLRVGWGIPMATDIAFALGILYLLGNKIPLSLKIFLTTLAVVDDLGAVIVIAFFYTSEISFISLAIGLGFVFLMFILNKVGVRSILVYAILGILGVWTAFLVSGVHATIAAILAAFTIPSNLRIKENLLVQKIQNHLNHFITIGTNDKTSTLTDKQLYVLENIQNDTKYAIPPLQRLGHIMHPFVTFVVLPIFALANAGVSLDFDLQSLFSTNVMLGVVLGLFVGKVIGVVGFTLLLIKLKITFFPKGMNLKNLFGLGFLATIGFTMSLFISSLAFTDEIHITQAKTGIFIASVLGGFIGYMILKKQKTPF